MSLARSRSPRRRPCQLRHGTPVRRRGRHASPPGPGAHTSLRRRRSIQARRRRRGTRPEQLQVSQLLGALLRGAAMVVDAAVGVLDAPVREHGPVQRERRLVE